MYKNILVPHAGTPAGDIALEHAIHIAKSSSSKIMILHVVEEAQYPPSFALSESERRELFKSIREYNEEIRHKMEIQIEKLSKKSSAKGIQTDIKVVIGSAADEILKLVNNKVDLIVMAKRRKLKGVKKLLSLGSVSRKIVENVTCPILLIDIEKK